MQRAGSTVTNSNGARSAARFADEAAADATGKGGASYEPEATALFARMTVQPDMTRKGLINTLIKSLKTAGVWAKLDVLHVLAAHDAQAARRNWIADLYNLTAVAAPTFTTDRGYQGDGTSSYLTTGGYTPNGGSVLALRDNNHLGAWLRTSLQNSSFDVGSPQFYIRSLFSGNVNGTNFSNTPPAAPVATGIGHAVTARADAANSRTYKDGLLAGAAAVASLTLTPTTIFVGARNNNGSGDLFSARQIAVVHGGANVTDADVAALYSALQTYLQAIGAA